MRTMNTVSHFSSWMMSRCFAPHTGSLKETNEVKNSASPFMTQFTLEESSTL